jgi:NAD(P)-dependent dehydrogenase (short-subunit alcohol dehydrogenase family)
VDFRFGALFSGERGLRQRQQMSMGNTGFSGRVVVITGAAGDIGFAMAERFAAAGAHIALLDRDGAVLRARCSKTFGDSAAVLVLKCDVADPAQTVAAVAHVVERYRAIHVLVNNAATVTAKSKVAALPLEDWQRAFDVNVTGAFLMAKAVIPRLRAAGGGVVMNVASQLGHVSAPGQAAYSASKAALLSLTRSIAVDHAADGVRAVSLSPGAVMTSRLTARYGSEAAVNTALASRQPLGRIGSVAEIAEAALFLVGDGAAFVSGADLLVDGGYTAV